MSVNLNTQCPTFESMRYSNVQARPSFKANEETAPVSQAQPVAVEKEPKKSLWQSFKNVYTGIKKVFVTVFENAKGAAKGLFYGGVGFAGIIGVDAIRNTIKKAPKTISTKGKVIASVVGLATLGYQLFNANLDANAKKANIDHRWQTGHNQ